MWSVCGHFVVLYNVVKTMKAMSWVIVIEGNSTPAGFQLRWSSREQASQVEDREKGQAKPGSSHHTVWSGTCARKQSKDLAQGFQDGS
jgi:hypothetical protein